MQLKLVPATVEDMERISEMTADSMSDPKRNNPGGRFFELVYPDYTTPQGRKEMSERLTIYATKFPNVTHSVKVVDGAAEDANRAVAFGMYTEEPEPPQPPPDMPSHYWDRYPGLKDYVGVLFRGAMKKRYTAYERGPNLTLQAICTDPAYQGKGAGSLIMNEMISRADQGGWICQIDGNREAVKFYERFGFQSEKIERERNEKWTSGEDMSYYFLVRDPKKKT